jgi:multiple sugar transport system substrate-binding protein
MKRLVSFVVAVMLIMSVFAGCSQKEITSSSSQEAEAEKPAEQEIQKKEPATPVTLVMWGGVPEESGPQQVAENFNKLDPNLQVKYIRFVNDDQGNVKLDTALMAGEQIDLFVSYSYDRLEKRIHGGLAADIADLCKKYDIDLVRDFGSAANQNITADGKIYAIPTVRFVNLIMLNKKMFDEANIPIPTDWTWDDLRSIAQRLTKGSGVDKVYGFLRSTDGVMIENYMSTKHNSDAWLNKDASATTFKENSDFKKGFQLFFDMMYNDESMMTWEDMIVQKVSANEAPLFFNGKVAMVFTGTHQIRNIKDTEKFPRDFVVAFAPVPKIDKDQSKYYANIQLLDNISVNSKSKYKDEAVKFVKWYYTEGFDPMVVGGRLPLYSQYSKDTVAKLIIEGTTNLMDEESFKNVVFGEYEDMTVPGSNKGRAELNKVITEEMEAYFLKQNDIDKTIENLQKRCDEVLKNAE